MAGRHTARGSDARWLAAALLAGAAFAPLYAADTPGSGTGQPPLIDPLASVVAPREVTRLAMDVSVTRRREAADGRHRGEAMPEVVYRVERILSGREWKTVMRRVGKRRAVVRHVDDEVEIDMRSPISRIEDAGDGTPARVINDRGVEVRLPSREKVRALAAGEAGALQRLGLPDAGTSAAERPATASPSDDPLRGLLVDARQRAIARRAIEADFGRPVGRVGGFERHVRTDGTDTVEVLVDPRTTHVAEIAVSRNGKRVERTRHVYVPAAGGALLRRAAHNERVLPDGSRLVTDVEFRNVRVGVGGAR